MSLPFSRPLQEGDTKNKSTKHYKRKSLIWFTIIRVSFSLSVVLPWRAWNLINFWWSGIFCGLVSYDVWSASRNVCERAIDPSSITVDESTPTLGFYDDLPSWAPNDWRAHSMISKYFDCCCLWSALLPPCLCLRLCLCVFVCVCLSVLFVCLFVCFFCLFVFYACLFAVFTFCRCIIPQYVPHQYVPGTLPVAAVRVLLLPPLLLCPSPLYLSRLQRIDSWEITSPSESPQNRFWDKLKREPDQPSRDINRCWYITDSMAKHKWRSNDTMGR